MTTEGDSKVWARLDQILDNQHKSRLAAEKLAGQIDLVKLKIETMEQSSHLNKQSHDLRIEKLEKGLKETQDKLDSEYRSIIDKLEPISKEIAKAHVIFAIIAASSVALIGVIQSYLGGK